MTDIDKDWIFDSVINFVKSPLWKVPITSFINENWIVFDNEEENKLEYTQIHKNFKTLVEEMLTNMLNEVGISEEIFAEACIKSSANPTHKMLLSEIMAVENFMAFKKLMLKRNRELNEEAEQIMSAQEAGIDPNLLYEDQNYGCALNADDDLARAIKASLEPSQPSSSVKPPTGDDDDEAMRLALEESKKEWEDKQASKKLEEEKVIATEVKKKKEKPKQVVKPKEEIPAVVEISSESELAPVKAPKTLTPIGGAKPVPVDFAVSQPKAKPKVIEEKKTVSKEEMQERMSNLRKQRDILLKKKQEALQKEWEEFDEGDSETTGDSRKDMIQKGLGALGIKESSVKYKTEEEKELEKQKLRLKKEKEEEEAKAAPKESSSSDSSKPVKEEEEESDEIKRRRMIYNRIKKLNMEEGNDF